ncbi:RNA polymerase sigma-70 factor (ECF subfamily) [Kribbella voronezhensis]|uniref:RNA polymerase sigma-70 factor (ECF subfamily) n=1 Tax=Kribbella voronezhensis TaxID=2512212 RepID=A0A4R7SZV0_9ACTN|nr:sigma-70 family RNA polymerase sigma factor [Kribbella voronezhensis]TDU84489.1 RNA polymerase sigma-70 factor (ECF subfamily) [Kribbella voronezhensis]
MEGIPPDDVLVARLRSGEESAFALVLDSWSGGMLRLARSFVSTEESAAEVVQETWLAVIEGIDRFEGRSSLKTWIYRILTNQAKRRGVREHKVVPLSSIQTGSSADDSGPTVDPARFRPPGDPYPGHWWEFPASWPTPEQGLLGGEARVLLSQALVELPERQRAVIVLRDVEGYSSDEVCDLLEISPGNQRVLLHRARAFLRGKLEEYYEEAKP